MRYLLIALCLFTSIYAQEAKVFAEHLEHIYISADGGEEFDSQNVSLEGDIPRAKKLTKKLEKYIGAPVTENLINKIKNRIVRHYRDSGYPVVAVVSKSHQRISSGNLKLEVRIGKLDRVKAEGATYFSNEWIEKEIHLQEGEVVRSRPVLDGLGWMNQNPFRQSRIVFEQSKRAGYTNATIITEDRFPIRVFGAYENNGNIIAGDSRFITGISIGDMWARDHQLNMQFYTAPNTTDWWGVAGTYLIPLPWKNILKVLGGYVRTEPDITARGLLTTENQKGKRWQLSGRYLIPLPTFATYSHTLQFGYDFKRTNNFGNISVQFFDENIDISQFMIGYQGNSVDSCGSTIFEFNFFLSPGDMTKFNKDRFFDQARQGADSFYIFVRGTVDRITEFSNWSLLTRFIGQFSKDRLLPSEAFVNGGFLTVRGYDENTIVSDRGLIFKNEIRTPPWKIIRRWKTTLQLLAFVDFGYSNDVDQEIFDKNSAVLASIGPGLRFNGGDYLEVRLDYGVQLHHISPSVRPFLSNDKSRLHAGVYLSF